MSLFFYFSICETYCTLSRRPGCPARKKAGEQVPRLCNHGKAGADGCEIALDEIAYSLQFIKGYSASKVGSIGA